MLRCGATREQLSGKNNPSDLAEPAALGRDRKDKVTDTSGRNEAPPQGTFLLGEGHWVEARTACPVHPGGRVAGLKIALGAPCSSCSHSRMS